MKKAFLATLFAVAAMICATSCDEKDNEGDNTPQNEDVNYPKNLTGYWMPVEAAHNTSYIIIGEVINGKAECSVHIDGAPIDLMTGYVTYNATTGAGTFELDAEIADRVPALASLVVKLQAKGENLMKVSRSLDGGNNFESADFKRVEKPDNGDTVTVSYPENLTGYWMPEDAAHNTSYILVYEDHNGYAECDVHIDGAPVDLMTGYIHYDATTGAGEFVLDEEIAERVPALASLVVRVQAKGEDLMTVSRSIDGGNHFESADFKRVEKPDNGGENSDTTWPAEPYGNFTGYDEANGWSFNSRIREDEGSYVFEMWSLDLDGEIIGTLTYDAETGKGTVTSLSSVLAAIEDHIQSFEDVSIEIEFTSEDIYTATVSINGIVYSTVVFERFDPAGKK